MRLLLLAPLIALCLAGCDAQDADGVGATARADALVVENDSDVPIWTFIAGEEILFVIDWIPTLSGPPIDKGARLELPWEDILRTETDTRVRVYFWTEVTRDGERVPGPVRDFTVDIPPGASPQTR